MAGLVKPLQWYRCSPLEQRWWLAFGLLINAARESVSRPLVDHDTVMPKRPRVSLRDTIFEQSDGVGARLYADEDDAFNRKGRSRAVSSKQVVVTRPTAPEPQEPEPAAPPYSADEVDAMRQQLSPGEIADLPPDQRAAYASRMGFPSESGGVPMSWRRPMSPAPHLPPHEQVSVSADVDGEKLTGSAMVSKPQD
ncbi:MAG TPA: hypothetical protein VGU72_04400 [Beijerinckiaceae bacterium]|nr:hypothetical protein [Beijerinckiaceae bacterium]